MTIRTAQPEEYGALVDIWERSVRASHHFLKEEDFKKIKAEMPHCYLPSVDLYVIETDGRIVGFLGLSHSTIEMLFIDADSFGRGFGSALINFALAKNVCKVDVNEQNTQALAFYTSKGFKIVARDECDSDGRPYPILHLSR